MRDISELVNFGILVIDKPAGWTSFDVVNFIRKSLCLEKAGHLGTLDPNATGVLPIVLGKACKIQEYFMHKDKTYIGKMKLHKAIERKILEEKMKKFLGKISQLPPRISRVKRQIRERNIEKFEILKFDKEKREAEFIAKVEAGTYIRKLVSDLGKEIGGAHMISLKRIQAGIFSSEDKEFCDIEKFKKAASEWKSGKEENLRKLIIDANEAIKKIMPNIKIKKEFEGKLKNGSPIFAEMIEDFWNTDKISEEPFAVFSGDNLIEIAKRSEQFKNPGIFAKPQVVLIKR